MSYFVLCIVHYNGVATQTGTGCGGIKEFIVGLNNIVLIASLYIANSALLEIGTS
jgi:hypothetical protein